MKNPILRIASIPETKLCFPKRSIPFLAVTCLAILLLAPAAQAGQGTASYLDFDDVNPGFGTPTDTSETALNWTTSAAGTVGSIARTSGTQLTIGAAGTDFPGPTPFSFAINLNGGGQSARGGDRQHERECHVYWHRQHS